MDWGPAQDPRDPLAVRRTRPPSLVIHANRKRSRKGGPSKRPRAPDLRPGRALMPRLPCKREGRTRARSLEATGQHTSIASAREARRTAPPPASTTHHGSHSPFVGDRTSHAGPRLPSPFGRSRLSAGEAQASAPQRRALLAMSEPPKANKVIKEKKEGRTKARTQQTQEQGREEAKEEE